MADKRDRKLFKSRMFRNIIVFVIILLILFSLIFVIVKYKESFAGKTKEDSFSGKVTAEINLENPNNEPRILRWWRSLVGMRKGS